MNYFQGKKVTVIIWHIIMLSLILFYFIFSLQDSQPNAKFCILSSQTPSILVIKPQISFIFQNILRGNTVPEARSTKKGKIVIKYIV